WYYHLQRFGGGWIPMRTLPPARIASSEGGGAVACGAAPPRVSVSVPIRGLHWSVHGPLLPAETTVGWPAPVPARLEALWAFRGAVLYDHGRRPQFRTAAGRLVDADPRDGHAYHVLAYRDHTLVGCVRLLPFAQEGASLTETLLGARRFRQMLC